MNPLVITIDGPAAAGKSTTARAVARHLGCLYLDSGAMYRAFALKAERVGLAARLGDEAALARLAAETEIGFTTDSETPRVVLDGTALDGEIRTPAISDLSSRVAAIPVVRRRMVELQRRLAAQRSLVAEGRDMGTVVFPDAAVKIFLDASLDERVRRRHLELVARGHEADPVQVRAEMAERDRRDREREVAPLRPAADAVVIDCTGLTVEGQIAAVLDAVRARTGRG